MRIWTRRGLRLVGALAVWMPLQAAAQSGTWTSTVAGFWNDPNNWLNGIVAFGPDQTAVLRADPANGTTVTVSVDGRNGTDPVVIGHITFEDPDPSTVDNWALGNQGFPLILSNNTSPLTIVSVNLAQGSPTNLLTGWGLATITANLVTTNRFVKAGPGTLVLSPAPDGPLTGMNQFSGGTIISNGMLQLGPTARDDSRNPVNSLALGGAAGGPIIFRGGILRSYLAAIPGSNPSTTPTVNGLPNDLIIEPGHTGTLYLSPRAFPAFSGSVHGGGTLNLFVDFVRDNLGGNWSGFTGRVVVAATPRQNGDLRFTDEFVNNGGWANARVYITTNGLNANIVNMYNNGSSGNIVAFGELAAEVPGVVNIFANNTGAGAGNSLPMILRVGGLNTDATFSGNFAAPGVANGIGIIKEGTGTWILNGPTIEYNGITVISNGVLQFGLGTSGKPGRTPVITNYATLAFGRSDELVVTNLIDGPGHVEQRGSGTLFLAPAGPGNLYTGRTIVRAGFLSVTNEVALGPHPAAFRSDAITLAGGGLRAVQDQTLGHANRGILIESSGGSLAADTNVTLTVANPISGSGPLRIAGVGQVRLAGNNTQTGRTVLSSGTLLLDSESLLGTPPANFVPDQLMFDGGSLRAIASFAIDDATRGVTVGSGGGTIALDSGTTLTLATPVSGPGTLTKIGGGTLRLTAVDNRTGATRVQAGTLAIAAGGSLTASSPIALASGAILDVTAAGYSLNAGQTLTGSGEVRGNLTAGNGSVLSPGESVGTLTVSGDLNLVGGATLQMDLATTTNDRLAVSGNLNLTGINTIQVNLLESLPPGSYRLMTYAGALSGSVANLTLGGYPPSRLVPSLTHDAAAKAIDLTITGQALQLIWRGGVAGNAWDVNTSANWLNNGNPDVFLNGDTVLFNATGAANSTVNLVGNLSPAQVVVEAASYTFSGTGKLTGLGSLTKRGADTLTVLTTNDYSGFTSIEAGTVQVGNGSLSGSLGTGPITNQGSLVYRLPDTRTVASLIRGTGQLVVQSGTVILTGDNTYSGATTIGSGAKLQVGNGGLTGTLGTGPVSLQGDLIYHRSGTVTNIGSIAGSGNLIVRGSGTVALAANNSWSGATLVDGGTLQVGIGGAAGTLGTAGTVTLTNGGTLAFYRSDNITNATAVVGTNGTLAQLGSGTLVLTSDGNQYGPTRVRAGRLQLGDGVNASGRLGIGPVVLDAPGQLVIARPDGYTLTNRLEGTGSLVLLGPTNAISTVGGANTYSGGTLISNAYVRLVAPTTSPAEAGMQQVNTSGLGTGQVTFVGTNVLELSTANAQDPTVNGAGNFNVPVHVPAGAQATFELPGRFTWSSTVTGEGVVQLGVNYVRGDVGGNWTNFTGVLNVVTNSVNPSPTAWDFRVATATGFPRARVRLADNVSMYSRAAANSVIPFGELSGAPLASIRAASGGGGSPGQPFTLVVGGLNTDATYAGTILDQVSVVKVGTGKWTLTGASTFTGSTTVSNGILALAAAPEGGNGDISSSGSITVVAPGILDVTGRTDGMLDVGAATAQVLRGNGMIRGNVQINWNGSLEPGFPDAHGTLTVDGTLTLYGPTTLKISRVAGPQSDRVAFRDIVVQPGVVLNVTQMDTNNLQTGDVFRLFSGPVPAANFGVINLPQQNVDGSVQYVWTNMLAVDGTVRLLVGAPPTVNPTPTNLVAVVSGGRLELSWPADRIGWRLLSNAVSVVASDQWYPIAGSETTNRIVITPNPARTNVFYRLVYP
ncbi:MAG: autotransporter-associated beta strand repeat-containing protein [Verrucomicrobiota bacterium]|nr:autotransporter-associated beta strand repeat-containing protein [Verrucomicrobiota bacterium]